MKLVRMMPWALKLDDNTLDCALYEGGPSQCEMLGEGECSTALYYLGSSDGHDLRFCLSHYFKINGDNEAGNWRIVFDKA